MGNRIQRILLASQLLLPTALVAQTSDDAVLDSIVNPGIERRAPKEAKIDSEDFELGLFVGSMFVEDFGASFLYGASLAYHITEDFFLEGVYARTEVGKTSFEELSGDIDILSSADRDFAYYDVSVGYNLFPGEVFVGSKYAFNSALYLIAGVGNTDFAGAQRFTVNVGIGYRLFANDWLAWRIDFRDHIFDIDILGEDKTTHNFAARTGITFFF
jgi:outer membrane beta-barrel protein